MIYLKEVFTVLVILIYVSVLRVKDLGVYSGNTKPWKKNNLSVAKELFIDNSTKEVGVRILGKSHQLDV